MTITSLHTQACFNAWMQCENLLSFIEQAGLSLSKKVTQVLDECAIVCMGTFNALKSGEEKNLDGIALLCVGICEECAEICEAEKNASLSECAKHCRQCSDAMSPLAFPAAINHGLVRL